MGSYRVGYDWRDLACMHALEKEMATHSSILVWRIPGTKEPGGLPSMGSHSQTQLKWLSSSSSSSKAGSTQRHGEKQAIMDCLSVAVTTQEEDSRAHFVFWDGLACSWINLLPSSFFIISIFSSLYVSLSLLKFIFWWEFQFLFG